MNSKRTELRRYAHYKRELWLQLGARYLRRLQCEDVVSKHPSRGLRCNEAVRVFRRKILSAANGLISQDPWPAALIFHSILRIMVCRAFSMIYDVRRVQIFLMEDTPVPERRLQAMGDSISDCAQEICTAGPCGPPRWLLLFRLVTSSDSER